MAEKKIGAATLNSLVFNGFAYRIAWRHSFRQDCRIHLNIYVRIKMNFAKAHLFEEVVVNQGCLPMNVKWGISPLMPSAGSVPPARLTCLRAKSVWVGRERKD